MVVVMTCLVRYRTDRGRRDSRRHRRVTKTCDRVVGLLAQSLHIVVGNLDGGVTQVFRPLVLMSFNCAFHNLSGHKSLVRHILALDSGLASNLDIVGRVVSSSKSRHPMFQVPSKKGGKKCEQYLPLFAPLRS